MTPGVRIRPATGNDAAELARLRFAFRADLDTPVEDRVTFESRCAAWIASRLRLPSPWRCWIAEADVGAIGMIWVQVVEKIPNPVAEPECHAYLTSFYVDPSSRGQGVGTRLLAESLAACDAAGADAVFLWPTPASRALYRRNGFSDSGAIMERRR